MEAVPGLVWVSVNCRCGDGGGEVSAGGVALVAMLRASSRLPSAETTRPSTSNDQHRFPGTMLRAVRSIAHPGNMARVILWQFSELAGPKDKGMANLLLPEDCCCEVYTDWVRDILQATFAHLSLLPAISNSSGLSSPVLVPSCRLLYPVSGDYFRLLEQSLHMIGTLRLYSRFENRGREGGLWPIQQSTVQLQSIKIGCQHI